MPLCVVPSLGAKQGEGMMRDNDLVIARRKKKHQERIEKQTLERTESDEVWNAQVPENARFGKGELQGGSAEGRGWPSGAQQQGCRMSISTKHRQRAQDELCPGSGNDRDRFSKESCQKTSMKS
jgi:hypothetical protein